MSLVRRFLLDLLLTRSWSRFYDTIPTNTALKYAMSKCFILSFIILTPLLLDDHTACVSRHQYALFRNSITIAICDSVCSTHIYTALVREFPGL